MPRADTGKTWTCLTCGEMIRRRSNPRPGSPFYEHTDAVILTSHDAVRAPRESNG